MSDGGDLIRLLLDLGFDRFLYFRDLLVHFVLMRFEIRTSLIANTVNWSLNLLNLCFDRIRNTLEVCLTLFCLICSCLIEKSLEIWRLWWLSLFKFFNGTLKFLLCDQRFDRIFYLWQFLTDLALMLIEIFLGFIAKAVNWIFELLMFGCQSIRNTFDFSLALASLLGSCLI